MFRITLAHSDPETGEATESRMSLVDLAGSESNAASAEFSAERRLEGVNINKGLSVLNRCIAAICNKEKYIPFRDSVLTKVRLLFGDKLSPMYVLILIVDSIQG